MKKAFVCSPYRGNIKNNLEKAKKYSWRTMIEGYMPITPHLYFGSFLDEEYASDRRSRMNLSREVLKECCELRVYADEVTEGMIDDIQAARSLNIPIKFFNADMEEVKYDSLIINKRIGPGYRQIIEEEHKQGKNHICPFAKKCGDMLKTASMLDLS